MDSLSFSRGVVRPGVTGEEHFLVSELWERSDRPDRPGEVHVDADLHGEAGPEPRAKLEQSSPGIKLVAGVTSGEPPAVLARRTLAGTQQGSPGAPGGGAGDTWHRGSRGSRHRGTLVLPDIVWLSG